MLNTLSSNKQTHHKFDDTVFDQHGAGVEQFHRDLGDVGLEVMNDALLLGVPLGLVQVVGSLFDIDQSYLKDHPIVMAYRSVLDQVLNNETRMK